MRQYTIKPQRMFISSSNIVSCRVCGRKPRRNRLVYEITSSLDKEIYASSKGAYVFHEGFTDTMKCALTVVLADK